MAERPVEDSDNRRSEAADGPRDFQTHASRTMMLGELSLLLEAVPADGTPEDYRRAVLEENVLLKKADSTRKKSLRHLRELYALDGRDPVFAAMRSLWERDQQGRQLLALLTAVFRDSLLRATAPRVADAPAGAALDAPVLSEAVAEALPDRLSPGILAKVGRNTASSWTQSGHLEGRYQKVRTRVEATPAAAAYALFLGHLTGVRGLPLYETLWARLLDAPADRLDSLAFAASRQGMIEYRRMGEVAEFGFSALEGAGRG